MTQKQLSRFWIQDVFNNFRTHGSWRKGVIFRWLVSVSAILDIFWLLWLLNKTKSRQNGSMQMRTIQEEPKTLIRLSVRRKMIRFLSLLLNVFIAHWKQKVSWIPQISGNLGQQISNQQTEEQHHKALSSDEDCELWLKVVGPLSSSTNPGY